MIPLQQGGNLSALSFALNDDDEADKDKETEALAEALDMDVEEISDEIIELEDGSVVINMEKTAKPSQDPDFYANLAEELEDGVLDNLAYEYLDLIEVDRESRKQTGTSPEEAIHQGFEQEWRKLERLKAEGGCQGAGALVEREAAQKAALAD